MKFQYEEKKHTKAVVAIGLVGLAFLVEAVSFAANYSIMHRSFADWPAAMQRALGFSSAVIVELAVIVLLVGMLYVFESTIEMTIAGITLALLVGTMGMNFVTSGHLANGQVLSSVETEWINWVGKLAIFLVFACVVALALFNPEAISRRKDRELQGKIKDARAQAYDQVFKSPEFSAQMGTRMTTFAADISAQVLPDAEPKALLTASNPSSVSTVKPVEKSSSERLNGRTDWHEQSRPNA